MKKLLTIVLFFINGLIFSQDQITFNSSNDGTTFVTCNGFIIDSGGQGGSGYSNNEDITITICPDTIGSGNNDDYITVIFNLFDLDTYDDNPAANAENLDYMYVYDGPSTASNSLGVYSGDDLESTTIQATNLNPSGCITLRFVSNSQNNTGTWQYTASATCATPCDPPVAAGEIVGGPTTDSIAVCVGDLVTFQENGSYAQASFNLVDYEWDFMDGNSATTTQGGIVQHAFSEPGEYQINLFVTDDNSDEVCQNNNLTDLRVYVATPPTFYEFPSDTTLCIGESVDLVAQPEIFDSTWAGFQGVTQIDDGCLYDDLLGVAQVVDLMQTGFTAGETIDDISDIESICLEMEHSYMGDLVIQVQCPNGQMITLHQQGGGGTQIGVPDQADDVNCDDGTGLGTPYIYCFTPSATETWVEWVTNNGWGQTLPAGDYESVDPLNGLIGCPLNGVWNLIVTDNWGADDGTVFGFGLNFESSLYPDVTEFTPQVGDNADSSFWDNSGAFITYTSADANTITVTPTTSGTYTYNYTVYDDFGCVNDSSLTITVDEQYVADAGLDQAICVGEIATLGPPTPQCSQDGGNYTYCYGNNENGTTWTFCPDTPGDGLTFMTVTFNSGNIETGWDELYVYDGNSTSGTQIGGLIDGDLSGLSFTATNFTGCITMEFYSDGSVSCASSSNYTEWDFDVSCGGGPSVVYDWSPSATLDDATAANPDASPTTTTNYTLSIYPTGHPDCVTTDDVNVTVSIPGDAGTDSTAVLCIEGAVVDLFNYLGGTPDTGGTWYDPNGVEVSMPALPDTLMDGMYEYVIGGGSCQTSARIDVSIKELTLTANVTGSVCNAFSGEVQLIPAGYTGDVEYSNDNGVNFQTSDTFTGMGGGNSYDFLAQDSLGCQATITEVVDDVDFPIIDATSVQLTDSDCGQDNGEVVTATTTGGTSPYQYYVDGQSTTQDLPIQNLSVSDPNTFDLIVVDANGCEDTTEITISEINQPLITDVVSTNVSCNSQADGQIEIIGNNLASYSIDNGVTFQNGTAIFTNLAPGTYQIMAASGEDGMYCQDSWSAVVEITEPDPLQISSITPDITVCPGDEVSLSVQGTGGNGNYTFDWSTSAQGEDIVVSPQQSMQVCVTMSEDWSVSNG